jgi:AraC family transcriptional regulator, transcriptional activator of pobA
LLVVITTMASKKVKSPIYKHAELMSDQLLDTQAAIEGFSVTLNEPLVEQEPFKTQFRSDFIAIFLITAGEVTFEINLTKYPATKNGLIVAPPNAIKQLVHFTKGATLSGISFTGDFMGKIGMPRNITELMEYFSSRYSPYWQLSAEHAVLITNQMQQLHQRCVAYHKHPYGKELLYHSLYSLFYEMTALSQVYAQPVSMHVSRKENLVVNFTNLVQKQFRYQRNVQLYANTLCITPKYLTETVKEITGKTAGEIIHDFVLQEAKLLLENPALSIAEIANDLHFSDQSFFGKFFKRHTGFSPKEYRTKY